MTNNPYESPATEAAEQPAHHNRRREWLFVGLSLVSFFVVGTAGAQLCSYLYRYGQDVFLVSVMPLHVWMGLVARLAGRLPGDCLSGLLLGRFVRRQTIQWVVAGLVGFVCCVHSFLFWWRGVDDPLIQYLGFSGLVAFRFFPLLTIPPTILLGIWIGRRELAKSPSGT